MRISDWSSDVCSSDLRIDRGVARKIGHPHAAAQIDERRRRADLVRQPRRERDRLRLRLGDRGAKIGRASCRERVCKYVEISVGAVSLKKNKTNDKKIKSQQKSIETNKIDVL